MKEKAGLKGAGTIVLLVIIGIFGLWAISGSPSWEDDCSDPRDVCFAYGLLGMFGAPDWLVDLVAD
jgi:hypothetical protein